MDGLDFPPLPGAVELRQQLVKSLGQSLKRLLRTASGDHFNRPAAYLEQWKPCEVKCFSELAALQREVSLAELKATQGPRAARHPLRDSCWRQVLGTILLAKLRGGEGALPCQAERWTKAFWGYLNAPPQGCRALAATKKHVSK